jgi:cold shock CspA family protein
VTCGVVKWFMDRKGYGFIQPDDGGKDLFVHHSQIAGEGPKILAEGARVEFEIRQGTKGPEAINVSVIELPTWLTPPVTSTAIMEGTLALRDVFICHASEDKVEVVRPLARSLKRRGVSIWLDEAELKIGDSLRQKVDDGLRSSRFGVVILSPDFFKKRWPQHELDGLADREMSSRSKVVLPVWHRVNHDDVARYSPTLAGKLAAVTSDGIPRVARLIVDAIS